MVYSINTVEAQGFRFLISTQNNDLTIEAQQKSTGKTFMIQLRRTSILQETKNIFETAEKMAEGLLAAMKGSEDLEFTIDSRGKLTFSALFKAGMIERKETFTLILREKAMELDEILDNRLNFFKEDNEQWKGAEERKMKERFDRLENMIMQMDQKITQKLDLLEKLHENLNSKVWKTGISFNPTSVKTSKWKLTNDNKTATSIVGDWPCLEIHPKISSNGQSSYSLRIDNMGERKMGFGITTETGNASWNEDQCSYRYALLNGKIYGGVSKNPTEKGPYGGNGTILKMVVDMDQRTLTFFVDKRQVNSCQISKSDKYFAYISVGNTGDSVTLL